MLAALVFRGIEISSKNGETGVFIWEVVNMNLLKATEVLCYVCRGILIEPVTLPCSHVFCRVCLEQSLQETSHSCPLCRKRISNWIRSSKKSNKFVDVNLWEKIKEQFKEQVSLKLKGEDDGLDQRKYLLFFNKVRLAGAPYNVWKFL